MPAQEKSKPTMKYSYGRGGAGCSRVGKASSTSTVDSKKRVVDPDIRPMPKMLELETARNRLTTGGRGGKNVYYHCIEPGVFQRVLEHEQALIVTRKAEEQANREHKQELKKRSKSVSLVDRQESASFSPSRLGTRLRSASTSTFATTFSGSSGGPPSTNLCSTPYLPTSSTASCDTDSRSTTPAPTITPELLNSPSRGMASRIFSPLRRLRGRKSSEGAMSVSSVQFSGDRGSTSTSTSRALGRIPFATTSVDPTRTTAVGCTSVRSPSTCSYRYPLEGASRTQLESLSTSSATRYQSWSSVELAGYGEANLGNSALPRGTSVQPTISTRHTQTEILHASRGRHMPALPQGRAVDVGYEQGKEGQSFTPYHLPLHSNIGYHRPGSTSRGGPR